MTQELLLNIAQQCFLQSSLFLPQNLIILIFGMSRLNVAFTARGPWCQHSVDFLSFLHLMIKLWFWELLTPHCTLLAGTGTQLGASSKPLMPAHPDSYSIWWMCAPFFVESLRIYIRAERSWNPNPKSRCLLLEWVLLWYAQNQRLRLLKWIKLFVRHIGLGIVFAFLSDQK